LNSHSESNVSLRVYDITGKLVAVLQDGRMNPGMNEIKWDASCCKPGIYYIELKTDESIKTIKAILFH
jgi:flagellar hook assembly protein FlgD